MTDNKLILLIIVILLVLFWVFLIHSQSGSIYYYNGKKYRVKRKLNTYNTYIIIVNGEICSEMIHINNKNDALIHKAIELYIRRKRL